MPMARSRHLFVLAFVVASLALGATAYLTRTVILPACSLRALQEGCLVAVAFVCASAWLHQPGRSGRRVYASFNMVPIAVGVAASLRQLWWQSRPPASDTLCTANLFDAHQSEALLQALEPFISGAPGCAAINWTLSGLSLPEWSLLVFTGLGLITLGQLIQR